MKKQLLFIFLLISTACTAQYQLTSSKFRYYNGIALSSRTDNSFGTIDSILLYARADSSLMFKYKGTARALAFSSALSSYKLANDSSFNTGFTSRWQTQKSIDSVTNIASLSSQSGMTVVDMHYGLLKGIGLLSTETPGTNAYTVATKAAKGATSIVLSVNASVTGSYPLVTGQLMVYGGYSGKWFTTRIQSISGSTITTANPLEDSIRTGNYVTNFYINESHPNLYGYYALADYAIKTAKTQYFVESRFNINTALSSGVVALSASNSAGNTGSSQITAYTVTSPTALTDGITATFNVNSTGSHLMKFIVNTLGYSVRARVTYNGINYDTTFSNSQPSSIDIPIWVSADSRSVTVSLAATSNGGQFILNENVAVLKVNGFTPNLNAQTQVLLGDSWFAQYYLDLRIRAELPNATIVNKGNGGYTSQQLIDVFNTQVSPSNPQVVWLIVGTNDYYQGVSAATFSANINRLKFMCDSIGAHLLLFTNSVGSAELYTTRFKLSRQYANLTKGYDENIGLTDSTFVPYTGATTDVNLGSNKLLTGQLNVSGSGNDARVTYNASLGMMIQGKAGVESDFSILNPSSGSYIYQVPTGTRNGVQWGSFSALFSPHPVAADSFLVASGSGGGTPAAIRYRSASQVRTDIGAGTVTSVATDATMKGGTITTSGTLKVDTVAIATRPRVQKGIDSLATLFLPLTAGSSKKLTGNLYFDNSAANRFILTSEDNTGTHALLMQAGGGSANYGGGLIMYAHSHATKSGWVTAGISSGSGGKFTVNSQGQGAGTDVFTVSATGLTNINSRVNVNGSTDNAAKALNVNGVIGLTAMNTAPSSASDTGVLGEIRITSTYIYVCTATNTWVRTALTTW